jgi:glycosyltransferase involved in cell wall biosynthesis
MNVVISQGLATGLPVIATRHSGLPEQVVDGVNGFLVEEGDYEALAGRIVELATHPELLASFGGNARGHVAAHFDAGMLIALQVDAYQALVSGG